jgi:hypothetical protein
MIVRVMFCCLLLLLGATATQGGIRIIRSAILSVESESELAATANDALGSESEAGIEDILSFYPNQDDDLVSAEITYGPIRDSSIGFHKNWIECSRLDRADWQCDKPYQDRYLMYRSQDKPVSLSDDISFETAENIVSLFLAVIADPAENQGCALGDTVVVSSIWSKMDPPVAGAYSIAVGRYAYHLELKDDSLEILGCGGIIE